MTDTRFNVRIGAKDETKAGLESAAGGFSSFQTKVIAANQALSLVSQTVGPVIRGIANLTSEYVDNGRELLALTRRLGGTVEMWDELIFVGEKYGVRQEAITMGLQRMTRRLGEMARFGKGEAAPALEALNIPIERFQGLNAQESYLVLADALSEIPDDGERAALAMKFFDSEGVALVQTMRDGAEGIRETIKEFREFGGITQDQAERAEKLGQKLDLLAQASENARRNFIEGFLRGIREDDIDRLARLAQTIGTLGGKAVGGLLNRGPGGFGTYSELPERTRTLLETPAEEARARRLAEFEAGAGARRDASDAAAKAAEEKAERLANLWRRVGAALDTTPSLEEALNPVVELLKVAATADKGPPITETIEGITKANVDAAQTGYTAAEALTHNINLTAQLEQEFGANVVDAAFRAADAWAYFAADAIVYGGNVFDALKEGMRGFLADTLGLLAQRATRSFVAAVLPLIPVVGPLFKEAASGAPPAGGFSGAPPLAFAGSAPANVNINVTTTFGTRSEAIQVAERVAGAMVEGGFMRRAF